jgi:hypothetical protein
MKQWLFAFLFTQTVEVPIYTIALTRRPWGSRVAIAVGASLLTHPIVWVLVIVSKHEDYLKVVAVAEAFAVLVEAAYLRVFNVRSALRWSLLANASSLGLGILSRLAVGHP